MTQKHIESVIFDLDGVIVDTLDVWTKAKEFAASQLNLDVPIDFFKNNSGKGLLEVAIELLIANDDNANFQIAEKFENIADNYAFEYYKNDLLPMEGVQKTFEILIYSGIKIGVFSNCPFRFIQVSLQRIGLLGSVSNIQSGHELKSPKPSPTGYRECCISLGSEPGASLAIEDTYHGALSAWRAGLNVMVLAKQPDTRLDHLNPIFVRDHKMAHSHLLNVIKSQG